MREEFRRAKRAANTKLLRLLRVLVVGSSMFFGSVLGFAQDAELEGSTTSDRAAQEEFRSGQAAYADGLFERALVHFDRAYTLSPRPELLYNLAATHDRLGNSEDAVRFYRQYLENVPGAANRAFTERRIAQLGQLAQDADEPDGAPAEVEELQEPSPPQHASAAPAIGVFSAAAATLIAGVGTGVGALRHRARLRDRCPDGVCNPSDRNDARRMNRLGIATDVLIGAGVVLAVVGLIVALRKRSEETTAHVHCNAQGCGATF